ncbi:O-antigen ligase family protein [Clostridium disporicum]|uniref:ExoQ family exopolysaccharide biosynthesis membrane protein n=1 Tax=Clostridium disporicum TaxID=84024 RepID=A0A174F9L1_9CLOT|nr:O-antigen ligase family protein [Clostridium disporicum]CUO46257.1 ExoQ family exopolysaccharide biosynthesis membrane protein [Clostridium disporicum]
MKKASIYYISYSVFIFCFMILCNNKLSKAVVFSGIFLLLGLGSFYINKNYLKSLIFLLGFCLPINLSFYYLNYYPDRNIAGALVGWKFTLLDLIIFLIIIYSFRNFTSKIFRKKINILILVYLLINIFSVNVALDKYAALFEVVRLLKCILLMYAIITTFNSELYDVFVDAIGKTIIVQFILGILQIIKGGNLGLSFLGESQRVFRDGVTGLEKGMSGTLGHPGTMAIFTLFCLTMLIFNTRLKNRKLYILISIITIILTFARTSIILMCFIIIIYKITTRKKFTLTYKKLIIVYLIAAISLVGALILKDQIGDIVNRFIASDFSNQVDGRGEHSQLAIQIYNNRESWSYGANNYIFASQKNFPNHYSLQHFKYIFPVHNLYCLYLVELGVWGMIIYIALISIPIINWFIFDILKGKKTNKYLITFAVWSIVIMIYNFTGWSGAKDILVYPMWIVLGLSECFSNKVIN